MSVYANERRNAPSAEDRRQADGQRPGTADKRAHRRDASPGPLAPGGYPSDAGRRSTGRPLAITGPSVGTRSSVARNKPQSKPNVILFYESTKPFYGFTNFSPHEVRYENKVYPTSEHLFQSMKVRFKTSTCSPVADPLLRVPACSSWSIDRCSRNTYGRLGSNQGWH